MVRSALSAFLAVLALAPTAPRVHAPDDPSLDEVVHRMAQYISSYGESTSLLIATETYTQESNVTGRPAEHRVLKSEFAIMRAGEGWAGLRDVFMVDGKALPDRDARLQHLLTEHDDGDAEARRISAESSRFNIGPVARNFNVPTAGLFFFSLDNVGRFAFAIKDKQPDRWTLTAREQLWPMLVHTADGVGIPIDATLDVNPETGVVMRTELRLSGFDAAGQTGASSFADIAVDYRLNSDIGLWLPALMTESYRGTHGLSVAMVTGRAEYGHYRQFQTSVRIK